MLIQKVTSSIIRTINKKPWIFEIFKVVCFHVSFRSNGRIDFYCPLPKKRKNKQISV